MSRNLFCTITVKIDSFCLFKIASGYKMTTLIHSYCSRHVLCVDHTKFENIGAFKEHLIETKVNVSKLFHFGGAEIFE